MLTKDHVSRLWIAHSGTVLRVVVALMALLTLLKLGDEVLRLVWRTDPGAAIDLIYRHRAVHAWFDGIPVYRKYPGSSFDPPGTYPLLWVLLGWLPLQPARAFWLAIAIIALGWTELIFMR